MQGKLANRLFGGGLEDTGTTERKDYKRHFIEGRLGEDTAFE